MREKIESERERKRETLLSEKKEAPANTGGEGIFRESSTRTSRRFEGHLETTARIPTSARLPAPSEIRDRLSTQQTAEDTVKAKVAANQPPLPDKVKQGCISQMLPLVSSVMPA
jgi:hypothetical protein